MSDYVLNENGLYLPSDYKVFEHPNILDISNRQMEQYQYWTDFVNWGRRNPVLFAERIFGVEFMDYQRYVFMMSWNTPYVVWCCSRGSGKALDLDTRIPTPDGDRTMRDIRIGDYVYDENGNPTRAINISPIFKNHDCYEIEFSDGEKIVADADHLWSVTTLSREDLIVNTRTIFENYCKSYRPIYLVPTYISAGQIGKKFITRISKVKSRPTKCIMVDSPSHLYLCGEKNTVTHNSILGSIFIMTKTLLIPNHTSYILCGVGSQSIELFTKIEKFVKNQIPSFKTLTNIYRSELVKSANSDGFVHNPASYRFGLYNNSQVFTLNGNFDGNRSKRSNLNFYDEAGFVGNEELFTTSEPFCTQNAKFGLGVDLSDDDLKTEPEPFANQLIYASSAGRTDQYFYKKYREASLHMDAGDKRYFCADINSDMIIHATKHGIALPQALLTQETIDSRMREDKEAGLREYGNIFTSEGGDGQIIRRASIIRNSVPMVPVLSNDSKDKLYGFAYDPARQHDNSVVGIAEYFQTESGEWKMRIVNMVSLADTMKKNKTPMSTPNQIKILKKLISDYVPVDDSSYDTLVSILVDAGSGGSGVPITDFLCLDWKDKDGNTRRGFIDPVFNEGDDKKFPNAVRDKLRLISPAKYKSELFESMIKMIEANAIIFPEEYLNKGRIELIYETDGKKILRQRYTYPSEEEEKALRKKGISVETRVHNLERDEELALKQIDAAKTELVNIYRFKQSSGKDRFDLAPEKANRLHDDRAYVLALLSYQLSLLRRSNIINRQKPKQDLSKLFKIRSPKKVTTYS